MSEEKHVVFQLGTESYSMNLAYVHAIEKQYSIIPLPDAPEHVKGMINLRGEIIPVYSLRSRFHMDELEQGADTKLLIAEHDGIRLAFEVDQVTGIEPIEAENHRDVPMVIRSAATSYIGGILNIRDQIVVEISIAHIMSGQEWETICQLIEEQR